MEKHTGFLLSYIKYGENDAVLHFFTKENGFQSYFLRGLYSAKNKKKAFLEPLNQLVITISSHKSSLAVIKKIELGEEIMVDKNIMQKTIVFFISDCLNQILRNEQKNLDFYQEINLFKKNLLEYKLHAHYIFLIKILDYFGISPLLTGENFLDVEKGIFQDLKNNFVDEIISKIWKEVLENKIDYSYSFEKEIRKKLLDSILLYYKAHFPEFYTPKSLPVIKEIFE